MPQKKKNMSDLQALLEPYIEKAVQNACNRLLGTLQELIDTEFYDVFSPDDYIRTYQFWRSATTEMLNKACGQVFMDASAMDYGKFWSGETQLRAANIGSHGGWITDSTREHRFWDSFIEYCKNNCVQILKEELGKQGIPIK